MARKKSKSNGPTPPATPKLASFPEPESSIPPKEEQRGEEVNNTSSSLGLVVDEAPSPATVEEEPAVQESTSVDISVSPPSSPKPIESLPAPPSISDASNPTSPPSSSSPSLPPPPSSSSEPILSSSSSSKPPLTNGSTSTSPSIASSSAPPPAPEPPRPSTPPPLPTAALASATSTLASLSLEPSISATASTSSPRPSLDLARPSLDSSSNGDDGAGSVRTAALEKAYDKLRLDKDNLEKQYRALVGKVGTMRDTLGKKLREDAEELDRREAQITTLTTDNATLTSEVATLRSELESQALETTSLSDSLSHLRLATSSSSESYLARERELHQEVERIRVEREEWEMIAEKERSRAEDEEERGRQLESDARRLREELERQTESAKREKERGGNLQSVLEEFQNAKDVELRAAVSELETHLRNTLTSLQDWKLRAATAESRLNDLKDDAGRSQGLEREVKEKNLLIGKLRHETVIMNEHLTEALRRLRRNSSDTNVDRRLVTNILISFLTTPRADPKRFEMLTLLSSILSWSDLEREQAGLQRASSGSAMNRRPSGAIQKVAKVEEEPASESFSQLFVEFLLKEATSGSAPSSSPSTNPDSSPSTPLASYAALLSPTGPPRSYSGTMSPPATTPYRDRTFSFGSTAGGPGVAASVTTESSAPPSPRPAMGRSNSFGLQQALASVEREQLQQHGLGLGTPEGKGKGRMI